MLVPGKFTGGIIGAFLAAVAGTILAPALLYAHGARRGRRAR